MGTRLGPRHAREVWGRKGHLSDYNRPHPEDLDVRKFGLMEDLLAAVNAALRARGWSARQASLEAVGSDQFIRNLRRGRVPPVDKLRALCDVLGLEFYIGPPPGSGNCRRAPLAGSHRDYRRDASRGRARAWIPGKGSGCRRGLRAHRSGALPRHHVPREASHRRDDGRDEEPAVAKVIRQAFACRDLADCGDECGNLPFRYTRAPPGPSDGGFDPPSRGLLCGVAVVGGFLISFRKRSVCGWSSNHLPTRLVTFLPALSFSGSWVGESRSVESGYESATTRRESIRSERGRGRRRGRSPSRPGPALHRLHGERVARWCRGFVSGLPGGGAGFVVVPSPSFLAPHPSTVRQARADGPHLRACLFGGGNLVLHAVTSDVSR